MLSGKGNERGKKKLKLVDNIHRGGYKDLNKTHGTGAVEDNSDEQDLPARRTPCGDFQNSFTLSSTQTF